MHDADPDPDQAPRDAAGEREVKRRPGRKQANARKRESRPREADRPDPFDRVRTLPPAPPREGQREQSAENQPAVEQPGRRRARCAEIGQRTLRPRERRGKPDREGDPRETRGRCEHARRPCEAADSTPVRPVHSRPVRVRAIRSRLAHRRFTSFSPRSSPHRYPHAAARLPMAGHSPLAKASPSAATTSSRASRARSRLGKETKAWTIPS